MNVGQISSGLSAANLGTKIGCAVLNQTPLCLGKDIMVFDKNMDAMKMAGEGLVKMINETPTPSKVSMERSVNPHIGGKVDMLV